MKFQEIIQQLSEIHLLKLQGQCFGLIGDLGAGKTYLVQQWVEKLDPQFKNQISSPTFSYCNIYHSDNIEIHHYDLYRIEDEDDLYGTGVFESINNSSILTLIEWVNLFPSLLQQCDHIVSVSGEKVEDNEYQIESIL
ncbi:MAG: tRNA threonylcarbamoyladenosine biosynthesis protein TsaE [bacterium]|jgi:tRNA threonylcarbamoyladenosine biosynthesis protein TsaE